MTQTPARGLDRERLTELLDLQDGVVSRKQLIELGALPHEIARMVRRRDLIRVHRGVFVNHTGPLLRIQREWSAVLAVWPAALTRGSALPGADHSDAVHVAVTASRTPARVEGVVVHRTPDFESRVVWVTSPPRVRVEHAAIDLAAERHREPVVVFRTLAWFPARARCWSGSTCASGVSTALSVGFGVWCTRWTEPHSRAPSRGWAPQPKVNSLIGKPEIGVMAPPLKLQALTSTWSVVATRWA